MDLHAYQMRGCYSGAGDTRQRTGHTALVRSGLTLLILGYALGLISLLVLPVRAQLQDERAVKVAFVFNLTKYVEWPQPVQELTIGFVGDGPMGEILQKVLAGKTSEARPVRIMLLPSQEQLQRCNILYIAESSPEKIHAVLEKIHNKNVLTVGDSDSFARNGGMVGLVRKGDQVQIQVNLEATEESHLRISSRVLDLATIVRSVPGVRN